jgi:hypothetical protein
MGNVRRIRPSEREELQRRIARLAERQLRRRARWREYAIDYQGLIDHKQLEIDNLRAQLDACEE